MRHLVVFSIIFLLPINSFADKSTKETAVEWQALNERVTKIERNNPLNKLVQPGDEIDYLFDAVFSNPEEVTLNIECRTYKMKATEYGLLQLDDNYVSHFFHSLKIIFFEGKEKHLYECFSGSSPCLGWVGDTDLSDNIVSLAKLKAIEDFLAEKIPKSAASKDTEVSVNPTVATVHADSTIPTGSLIERIENVHMKLDNGDWHHDNIRFGVLPYYTMNGMVLAVSINAYPGYRKALPNRWNATNIHRKLSWFFAVGTYSATSDKTASFGPSYALGISIDVLNGMAISTGVAGYNVTSASGQGRYVTSGLLGVTLNSEFWKTLMKN